MLYPPNRYLSDNQEKYLMEEDDLFYTFQVNNQEEVDNNYTTDKLNESTLEHYLIKEGILPDWI